VVEASVRRNAVKPGAYRRASLEPSQAPPSPEQSFLDKVLRLVERAKHSVTVQVEFSTIGLNESRERLLISRSRVGHQAGNLDLD
jgi:hypothetical protein